MLMVAYTNHTKHWFQGLLSTRVTQRKLFSERPSPKGCLNVFKIAGSTFSGSNHPSVEPQYHFRRPSTLAKLSGCISTSLLVTLNTMVVAMWLYSEADMHALIVLFHFICHLQSHQFVHLLKNWWVMLWHNKCKSTSWFEILINFVQNCNLVLYPL